jgi:hypothetical protein
MDRMLRAEIIATVRQTVWEVLEGADEVYLTPQQLAERISFLPLEWIRKNGELLPRECAIVMVDGKPKKTNDGYPLHKIMHMIQEGKLKNLVKTKNRKTAADATGTVAAMQ